MTLSTSINSHRLVIAGLRSSQYAYRIYLVSMHGMYWVTVDSSVREISWWRRREGWESRYGWWGSRSRGRRGSREEYWALY